MSMHANVCTAEDSLLIIVDMQMKLAAAMDKSAVTAMLVNSSRLLEAAAILQIPVMITEQYPQGLGPTAAEIIDKLPGGSLQFAKTGFSCCAADGLNNALVDHQRQKIILLGQETHVCVLQTALDLIHRGYQVYVVEDAVCSRTATHKHNALRRMEQLNITITNYESVLFEWLKDASHPSFKAISTLLR